MSNPLIGRPPATEYAPYQESYVKLVPDGDLLAYFQTQNANLASLLSTLSEDQLLHRYAEGKWSVKDIAQHIIDTERIFCYRALTFARGDTISLPGFEENDYVIAAHADARTNESLCNEYDAVRSSTIEMFRSFSPDQLARTGIANTYKLSVRGIGYVIAGHELHHLGVIRERYLL